MTWIRTIPLPEADEKLRRAIDAQKALYPKEYESPVHPTADGTSGVPMVIGVAPKRLTNSACSGEVTRSFWPFMSSSEVSFRLE